MTSRQPDAQIRLIDDPGCQQMVGYRTEIDLATGDCEVTLNLGPQHLNRNGLLHGGIVATLMDVVCGNTASQHFDQQAHPPVVTVSLTLSYVAAVQAGRVRATAAAQGGGASLAYVSGALHGEDGTLLATASGVFKRIKR